MQNACRPVARGDRATGFLRRASGLRGLRDSPLLARRLASEPVGTLLGPPPPPVQTATSSTEVDYDSTDGLLTLPERRDDHQNGGEPNRSSTTGLSRSPKPVGSSRKKSTLVAR